MPTARWFLTGWRLAYVVFCIALGAALTLTSSLHVSSSRQVSTTVFVDPSVSRASTTSTDPASQRAALDDYIASAQSDVVLEAAARANGLSVAALKSGLSVASVGQTNAVIVQFRSQGPVTRGVVESVAAQALQTYSRSALAQLQKAVALYGANYDASTTALSTYARSTGEVAPDVHYQVLVQAMAQGDAPPGGAQEVRRLEEIIPQFRNLTAAQVRAGNLLQSAQGRLLDLRAALQESADPSSVVAGPVVVLSRFGTVVRFGALGAVAGTIVAAACLLLLGLIPGLGARGQGREVSETARTSREAGLLAERQREGQDLSAGLPSGGSS